MQERASYYSKANIPSEQVRYNRNAGVAKWQTRGLVQQSLLKGFLYKPLALKSRGGSIPLARTTHL
jgi:hypothetical protein